jgi:transketolase
MLSIDRYRRRILEIQAGSAPASSRCRVGMFERQPQAYRDAVLPPDIRARVSIEAASPFGWERYVGSEGAIIGINRFGVSAPGPALMREFGFTPEHIVDTAKAVRSRSVGAFRIEPQPFSLKA